MVSGTAGMLEEFKKPSIRKSILMRISHLYDEVENRDMMVDRVEMGEEYFKELANNFSNEFDIATHDEVRCWGIVGHLWGAEIYVGKVFGEPVVYGENEVPTEGTLWIRRGWEREV